MHARASDPLHESADETRVALRVDRAERDRLSRLAKLHDRTLSGEIRRAIRFYLADVVGAESPLREQAGAAVTPETRSQV